MPLLSCPSCNVGMQEINRNQVLIDVCTQCRGVWLDRGELEKILGMGRQEESQMHREREYYYKQHQKPYYKKKHWLLDLLD